MTALEFPDGWWHPGRVAALATVETPDGPRLAAGDDSGTVRLWDPARPTDRPTLLTGHTGRVLSLAVVDTPDGHRLATGDSHGTVYLWDPARPTDRPTTLPGHDSPVLALAGLTTPDGPRLATAGSGGTVLLWDPARPAAAPTALTGHTGPVRALAAVDTPGGPRLAVGDASGTVRLWDLARPGDKPTLLSRHGSPVLALAAVDTPDGPRLAASDRSGTVHLWDTTRPTEEPTALTGHNGSVYALAAVDTPDGPRLAASDRSGTVHLWDPARPTAKPTPLTGHRDSVRALAAVDTPGGPRLATGDRSGTVRLWDPARPTDEPTPLTGHTGPVRALAAVDTPGGPRLATGERSGTVRLWDPARPTDKPTLFTGHTGPVYALAALDMPGGPLLATAGRDGRIGLAYLSRDRPALALREQTPLLHDLPTAEDALDRLPLAQDLDLRLARFLATQESHAPLAVKVEGPWGSGKTSLVRLMTQVRQAPPEPGGAAPLPWLVIHHDAWREANVGPVWWSLAQAMRSGVGAGRSLGFRHLFRVLDAGRRALRTPTWLILLTVPVVVAAVLLVETDIVGQARDWSALLTGVVGLALVANKYLFWDSPAGARLHVRSDDNPLGDVAAHVAWLRRWSPRLALPGAAPIVARLVLLATGVLVARSWLGVPAGEPGDVTTWAVFGVAIVVVAALGPGEVWSRGRPGAPRPAATAALDRPARTWTVVGVASAAVAAAVWVPLPPGATGPVAVALFVAALAWCAWLARRWWAGGKRPILFVIDDIDRCDARTVVEVLESVQTLMREDSAPHSQSRHPAPMVFLVLADGRWIRTAFEERYKPFGDTVDEPGHSLGHLFLDKLFQISVTIPAVRPRQFEQYVESLLRGTPPVHAPGGQPRWTPEPTGGARSGPTPGPRPADATAGADGLSEQAKTLGERLRHAASEEELFDAGLRQEMEALRPHERRRVEREQVVRSFAFEDETGGHLLSTYHTLLPRNPRAVKRFVNAYGLNRTIAYTCLGVPRQSDTSDRLARWTLLTMRWPDLADVLRRNPDILDDASRADKHIKALLKDEAVRRLLEGDGARLGRDDIALLTGGPGRQTATAGGDQAGPS